MVSLIHAYLKIGDKQILKDLNLYIAPGEKVALLGETGSGKSSFLNLLAGKVFPSRGKIKKPHYTQISLVHRDYSFHKVVGSAYQYYQQRYHAFDAEIGPTLYEVIQNQVKPLGTVDDRSVDLPPPTYTNETVKKVASSMNISHLLNRKVITLSNGETRRALISLSLLKSPKLLLLDNPFTGLDKESKALLKNLLEGLDITIVMVCGKNDLPQSFSNCLIIEKGTIRKGTLRDYKPKVQDTSYRKNLLNDIGSSPYKDFKIAFAINNGWVHYGNKKALDQVSWTVNAGEKWALMGPNGSGKSTLLSLIMADNPQAYQNDLVLFDKKRGSGESIWDLKKRTGYISPEYHMYFPKLQRVWKVVASGLFDSIGLLKNLKPEEEKTLNMYLSLLGLQAIRERALNQLSTGEQRKVLLARALIKNPALLVLDEPCQNLDYSNMVYFRDLINEIVVTLGTTLIYVTHNPEEIPSCINRTLYLTEGRVLDLQL